MTDRELERQVAEALEALMEQEPLTTALARALVTKQLAPFIAAALRATAEDGAPSPLDVPSRIREREIQRHLRHGLAALKGES